MVICRWLPSLVPYNSDTEWGEYQEHIYSIFCDDFKISYPVFENKRVKIRYHPIESGKEEAFIHVTCQDYLKDGKREPDLKRCERIRWVRKFIENYKCIDGCKTCDGIKVWDKPYKNTLRTHILLEEEKYIVVLEKRPEYCLLITAYYFDKGHMLDKKLRDYQKFK